MQDVSDDASRANGFRECCDCGQKMCEEYRQILNGNER